jgi:hypothetical protein
VYDFSREQPIPVVRQYVVRDDLEDVMAKISDGWQVMAAIINEESEYPQYILVLP